MTYTIRPTTSEDYGVLAALINQTKPNFPTTAENLREGDLRRPEYCKSARWVAEQEGQVIGVGSYVQHADSYDPHLVNVGIRVHPDHEGQGIGQALNTMVETDATALGMTQFRTAFSEAHTRSLDFAAHAGYQEYGRRIESELDLTTFDPSPFASIIPDLEAAGIHLRTYSQLAGDPALDRAVYDLQMATEMDVPVAFTFTPPPFEEYRADLLSHPKVPHDGIIVAVVGRELVGMTMHYHVNPAHINVDYTGVRRDFRGKGIALALKVAGATYAQSCGAQTLFTTNDPGNPAILSVNHKLGFVQKPALLLMKKEIG